MRILGIHYFAPPVAVVSSRRLTAVYDVWRSQAQSIDLITSATHKTRTHESAYEHAYPLHFVAGSGLRELFFGQRNTAIGSQAKKTKGFSVLNRWRQSFPFLYLTDEGGPGYFKNALQKGRELIRTRKITHLFSSYRPWVDHRVAAALKKEFPELHWIADFRDLPVDQMRKDVAWPGWQQNTARSIIRAADEVWAVSEGQAAQLASYHPNIKVIYNALAALPSPSNPPATENFVINYTGSLYPGLQSIKVLQEALKSQQFITGIASMRTIIATPKTLGSQRLKNTEDEAMKASSPSSVSSEKALDILWQYAGKDGEIWKRMLEEFSDFSVDFQKKSTAPMLSKHQATARQTTATTNVLLTWSGQDYHGVLTAKLFDYLAAGRPITAIINGPDDPELRRIIEDSGAGKVFCDGQAPQLAAWLAKLYTNWATNQGRLPWATDAESLRPLLMQEQLKTVL